MSVIKPNYIHLGLSSTMGPQLRRLVEKQLTKDLRAHGLTVKELKFDWSESCIEGHDSNYLDGSLENFSGIKVFDVTDQLVAEGWMDFIHEGPFFLAYWEYLTLIRNGSEVPKKLLLGFRVIFGTSFLRVLKEIRNLRNQLINDDCCTELISQIFKGLFNIYLGEVVKT